MSQEISHIHPTWKVVCSGDGLLANAHGAGEVLERLCRVDRPEVPWKFWHQADAGCSAARLRQEAVWRILGHGAGTVVLSLGQVEVAQEDRAVDVVVQEILEAMDVLASKGPPNLWLLAPVPLFWPLRLRDRVQAMREGLMKQPGSWKIIDPLERAKAFVEAQAKHEDEAWGLADEGPTLTHAGSLLVAQEILRAWQ